MPYTHHSHSGQFCGHATDNLEEIVKAAIGKNMETLVLTEHMPRDRDDDLYPEEIKTGISTAYLFGLFDSYYTEARRLQETYSTDICILVGFEIDWIRSTSKGVVESLLSKYQFDTFIGSVHHVHEIPIDYDLPLYEEARAVANGAAPTERLDLDAMLFEDYFDTQFAMLEALKPPIVGHFDLIRLKSHDPNVSMQSKPPVWKKVERNLRLLSEYGGVLELNSAALRKGMSEPYPRREICKLFLSMGGRFVLSDDSHGLNQLAYGYEGMMAFIKDIGIEKMSILKRGEVTMDLRFPDIATVEVLVKDVAGHTFFAKAKLG